MHRTNPSCCSHAGLCWCIVPISPVSPWSNFSNDRGTAINCDRKLSWMTIWYFQLQGLVALWKLERLERCVQSTKLENKKTHGFSKRWIQRSSEFGMPESKCYNMCQWRHIPFPTCSFGFLSFRFIFSSGLRLSRDFWSTSVLKYPSDRNDARSKSAKNKSYSI